MKNNLMSDDSESVYTTFQSGKQSVVEAKPLQNNNKWNTFSNKRSHVHVHILLRSKTAKFPFQSMNYSPWSSKNSIDRNWLEKFMQVGIDVKCIHTNFGGCGFSGFGDKINLWSIKVEKFNRLESAQKIHATRGQCHMHAHQFWWV